jgi:hypothetical protein
MNYFFLTPPRSEHCTQRLSPPRQRNLLIPKRALDGKDNSFSAPSSNKRARIGLPMMPTLDANDNVSFAAYMLLLPKTRLSRRNADFQPAWPQSSSHKANDTPELTTADLVDASEALRLMPFKKSTISSDFSFPRPSHERSDSLIFLPRAA